MGTAWDQMRMQDGMHLILDPRAVADHLVAARHLTPQAFGVGVRQPNFRQEVRRPQGRKYAGVDLVGLNLRIGDGLDLHRVGHDHPRDMRLKCPHDRHCVAGRLDDDFVLSLPSVRPKPSSPARDMSTRPAGRSWPASQITTSAKVRWMSMPITRLITCSPSGCFELGAVGNTTTTDPRSRRNRVGRRGGQLLTRALGSSYGSACPLTCSRCPSSRMVAPYARTQRPSRTSRHRDPHTGYQPDRAAEQEVKRRADVVGIFPNEPSIIRLIGAVLLEQNDEWQLQHRYMQVEAMAELLAPASEAETKQIAA